jgi:two-component system LytT family response regulator
MLNAIVIYAEGNIAGQPGTLIAQHLHHVVISGCVKCCPEGLAVIDTCRPDIIFLDTGISDPGALALLNTLAHKDFSLVFITIGPQGIAAATSRSASAELTLKAAIEELQHSVDTILSMRQARGAGNVGVDKVRRVGFTGRLPLPVREGVIFQAVADIVWIQSDGSYSLFHTTDGQKHMVCRGMSEFEHLLPEREFFRVHRSHIINIKKVKKYIRTDGYYAEMENGTLLEIARRKKDDFLLLMNTLE